MRSVFNILTILFLSWPSLIYAQERHEFYTGVRQMGMGGTVVATVNDETALISNPAGLGKLRDSFITILDPELSGNGGLYDMTTKGPALDAMDPSKVFTYLLENPKQAVHWKAQLFPSLVFPHFGFGVLAKYESTIYIDETTGKVVINYYNDTAAILGYNLRIWEGRIKLGFSAKAINRIEVKEDYRTTTTTNLEVNNIAKEGVGIAGDVGLILTGPWTWLPSLAAVWRDVGNTKFNQNDGLLLSTDERPDQVRQSLDVGFSVTPILSNYSRMQIALEYRDALEIPDADSDPMKKYHAGLEFNFYDSIFLRGGMNQRYYTAGFEIAIGTLQFQGATYGEEIGTKDNPREDRRYVGKFSFRF